MVTAGAFFFSLWGLSLYWFPAAICLFDHFDDVFKKVAEDQRSREKDCYYCPSLTWGYVFFGAVMSVMPLANVAGVLYLSCQKLSGILDTPLVPDTEAAKAARDAKRNSKKD